MHSPPSLPFGRHGVNAGTLGTIKRKKMSQINKASITIIVFSILLNSQIQSQSIERIDSLVNEACQTINQISNENESVSLETVLHQVKEIHLDEYLLKIPSNKLDSTLLQFDARLQKTCEEYGRILYEQLENDGDWVRHSIQPKQKIKHEDCKFFYTSKEYSYLETNGDTVKLEIKNGYWIDNFKDGTYSKLKISTNENCEFEIEFIESNNEIRKNFSKKGDKYKYRIIDGNIGLYKLSVEIPEQSIYYTFNIYYKE